MCLSSPAYERATSGPGTRYFGKPRPDSEQIHRRSGREMLQVGLGEPQVPRTPQVADPDPLRQRAFDARPYRVRFLELVRGLALPGGLERFVLGSRAYGQRPRLSGCMGALVAYRAGHAISACEPHVDDIVVMTILARHPEHTRAALRAGGGGGVPVNHKGRYIKALLGFGLPANVGGHRPQERDIVQLLAADQMVGGDIAGIHDVFARQQLPRRPDPLGWSAAGRNPQ